MAKREAPPKLGPEHEKLKVFVGHWTSEGQTAGDPPSSMAQRHTYEIMPGGFFLVHKWEGRIGDRDNQGMEIIGYDAQKQSYFSRFFDNGGWAREYQLEPEGDDSWAFWGEHERALAQFVDGGRVMEVKWEMSEDGKTWKPLCDVRATKTR